MIVGSGEACGQRQKDPVLQFFKMANLVSEMRLNYNLFISAKTWT